MIDESPIKKILEEKFPNFKIIYKEEYFEIYIKKNEIFDTIKKIKEDPELCYDQLTDLTAVDYPSREERFELIYLFLSMTLNSRIVIKSSIKIEDKIDKERGKKREEYADKIEAYKAEDAAIEAELKMMADNQILLMQNERCPFLKVQMQDSEIEKVFTEVSDGEKENIVFQKEFTEFESFNKFYHSEPIKLYGLEKAWKSTRETPGVHDLKNALVHAMARGCGVARFGMKPRLQEPPLKREQRAVFAFFWDGEEIVIGDEEVWEKMNDNEKEIARLRGKVLQRNGALGGLGGGDGITKYMTALFSSEEEDE